MRAITGSQWNNNGPSFANLISYFGNKGRKKTFVRAVQSWRNRVCGQEMLSWSGVSSMSSKGVMSAAKRNTDESMPHHMLHSAQVSTGVDYTQTLGPKAGVTNAVADVPLKAFGAVCAVPWGGPLQ